MAGPYRRSSTPEQREKAAQSRESKLAELHQTLTEEVSALASGPQWRAWLEVAARFHNYSFNNTLLLGAQRPDATQVAGYALWRELGRQVAKGEKGLMILAPVTRNAEDTATAEQEPTAASRSALQPPGDPTITPEQPTAAGMARRVVGFRPAYVWDISQTSGQELPSPPTPRLLAGAAPEGLWDALAAQCSAAGFTVDRRPIHGDVGPNGYTTYTTHEVVVRSDVDDAQAVKTLAHELGHVLMHDPSQFPDGHTGSCRGAREVEAESVAYLVAADHGLDTAEYTFAYIAGWAAQTGDVNAAVAESGVRVLSTAHHVLDTSHAHQSAATDTHAATLDTGEQLAGRAETGADRTAALRAAAPASPPAPGAPARDRLIAANDAAMAYFGEQYPGSWAPAYLSERLGTSELNTTVKRVGYAPRGWTTLTEHLRGEGFTDDDILGAGLGTRASTGRVVDRFRDRLVMPIRASGQDGSSVVGFIGRRNPAEDTTTDARNPKYLNTPRTVLYIKGEQLFGLTEGMPALDRGGVAVLVEGPIDAFAVDVASHRAMVGVASLGTAVTEGHAAQLRAALGAGSDRIVVATDADPAGAQAGTRAYTLLCAHRLDPRSAALPDGLDPAATAQQHGPDSLVARIATAEPMGRQLVDDALNGRELDTPEARVSAARMAGAVIGQAPTNTWQREIEAVTEHIGLDSGLLHNAVAEAIATDTDGLLSLRASVRHDDPRQVPRADANDAPRSARKTLRPPQNAGVTSSTSGPLGSSSAQPTATSTVNGTGLDAPKTVRRMDCDGITDDSGYGYGQSYSDRHRGAGTSSKATNTR